MTAACGCPPLICGVCGSRLEARDEPNLLACQCGASRLRMAAPATGPREPRWWPSLREALERTGGTISTSCDLAGVARQVVYRREGYDPTFRQQFRSLVRRVRVSKRADRHYLSR